MARLSRCPVTSSGGAPLAGAVVSVRDNTGTQVFSGTDRCARPGRDIPIITKIVQQQTDRLHALDDHVQQHEFHGVCLGHGLYGQLDAGNDGSVTYIDDRLDGQRRTADH